MEIDYSDTQYILVYINKCISTLNIKYKYRLQWHTLFIVQSHSKFTLKLSMNID